MKTLNEIFNIEELKGFAIIKAITNMQEQLLNDNNEINCIEDITLDRIFAEIDCIQIKFDKNGNIILN